MRGDEAIKKAISDLITFPSASMRHISNDTDEAIDIVIPKYEFGEYFPYNIGWFFIPFFWRPTITITARTYNLSTNETIYAATVTQKMELIVWWKKNIRFSSLLSINRPNMSIAEIERFTIQAATKLLEKISKNS